MFPMVIGASIHPALLFSVNRQINPFGVRETIIRLPSYYFISINVSITSPALLRSDSQGVVPYYTILGFKYLLSSNFTFQERLRNSHLRHSKWRYATLHHIQLLGLYISIVKLLEKKYG